LYSTNVRMTKMNNRKRELIEHLVRSRSARGLSRINVTVIYVVILSWRKWAEKYLQFAV